jgi:type VI secretion system secreted protein VgrG
MIALSIEIAGVETDLLRPFAVDGTEALSTLFAFDILCLSPAAETPLGPECLGRAGKLTISPEGAAQRVVSGVVEDLRIVQSALDNQAIYRIRLAPGLCRLQLSRHNRIYGTVERNSVVDILGSMLQGTLQRGSRADDTGTPMLQHDFRLRHTYPQFDHVTQYEEADFTFLSRLTEHWGIHFFFEHHNGVDQIVFADDPVFAPVLGDMARLRYVPPYVARGPAQPNTVQRFEVRYHQVANRMFLQD